MAEFGSVNGWADIIVKGGGRDAERLCAIGFGVVALGSTGTEEFVTFGGVGFRPDGVVHADADGIVGIRAAS